MRTRVCLWLLCLGLVATGAVHAQDCDAEAMVGDFTITFEGATFDGSNTTFDYCVTNDGGKALSHWDLGLNTQCIGEADVLDCSPKPCEYGTDPTLGITGIKFDDLEVESGETECYSFTLAGDWSSMIGDTTVGTKAGQNNEFGNICGPICVGCGGAVSILSGEELLLSISLTHNRPPTVVTPITYTIYDRSGAIVHSWEESDVTFVFGETYSYLGEIPGLSALPQGRYGLEVTLEGMSGWVTRYHAFDIYE